MIKTLDPKVPVAAAEGTAPFEPEQMIDQLRAMRDHVPDFGPLPIPDAQALRTTASIPPEFRRAAFNTIGTSAHISRALDATVPDALAEEANVNRWSAFEDELRTLLEGVAASNLARRHRLGLLALQVYGITRQLVREKAHADLLPHFENMRRTNRLGKRREAKADEPATPAKAA
ncbi:MAG TPA: hypothetical protein VF432_21000 [Thermoanaerobaculia bacterium]